jgi:hypothetical protein
LDLKASDTMFRLELVSRRFMLVLWTRPREYGPEMCFF